MHQQISTKRPSPQKMVEEEEAAVDTQLIEGKDKRNIEALAYTLYEQRGREDGYDLDDWLEAERRIVSLGQARGF
jgi:hypothetical protein